MIVKNFQHNAKTKCQGSSIMMASYDVTTMGMMELKLAKNKNMNSE